MISEITNRLRTITLSLEEADALHKAIDGRTRPQPAVVTPTHDAGFSDEETLGDSVRDSQPYIGKQGDGSPCITQTRSGGISPKAESAVHSWHVAVVVDDLDTYCEEFIGEKAAREVLGKLTNEINEAIKHDIALVRFGNASFRPEDVAAIEVHGA